MQPFERKRLHKFPKFRAEQPNFRSKLFSEFLLSSKQPGDAYCHRVAFVVRLIILFADKALLCGGDLFFRFFTAADQQLFDSRRRDFFINCATLLPCDQIGNAYNLEQRLRLVRESGEALFPHEDVNAFRLFAEQIVDGGEDFAMAGFAVSRVKMAQALNLNVSILVALNGKARTSKRQIGRQNPQRFRQSRQFGLAHDRPRRRTLRVGWRAPDDRRWYRRRDRRRGAG